MWYLVGENTTVGEGIEKMGVLMDSTWTLMDRAASFVTWIRSRGHK